MKDPEIEEIKRLAGIKPVPVHKKISSWYRKLRNDLKFFRTVIMIYCLVAYAYVMALFGVEVK
jgi:hypothetical protein